MRSANSVPGRITLTVTVCAAERGRPSDCATCALEYTTFAMRRRPGVLCHVPAILMSNGSIYDASAFTCVRNGDSTSQKSVLVEGVVASPRWVPTPTPPATADVVPPEKEGVTDTSGRAVTMPQ